MMERRSVCSPTEENIRDNRGTSLWRKPRLASATLMPMEKVSPAQSHREAAQQHNPDLPKACVSSSTRPDRRGGSGFSVPGARSFPDAQMLAYSEMLDGCRAITEAVTSVSLMATPDMVAPKKCGHTAGKEATPLEDACMRVKAAIDARSGGADMCILARTDARASLG
ncbi:unnamed protein product [Vitrella brassicaformis CCMP3155]|uniref:Uncharacterized protein n=1 Tax=Vitrella brassicaformis (strain CCMP3155) TaxID=1169540 RepID=A0A0G4EWM6_VITBC|nr:unnamed protein product [Vitrella brassicaformis CCMP3155]|eukprot:CEM02761.1 unnamed protein product [Vitrella brassicaformis CCMP3155]